MNLVNAVLQGGLTADQIRGMLAVGILDEDLGDAFFASQETPSEVLEEPEDWWEEDYTCPYDVYEFGDDDYDPLDDMTEEEIRALDEGMEEFEERRRRRAAESAEY